MLKRILLTIPLGLALLTGFILPSDHASGIVDGSRVMTYLPLIDRAGSSPFLAHHVIVMIGSGMGFEQVKAGGMYLHGAAGKLPFEAFPYKAQMTTRSANSAITDPAAASTAMATGHKVNNGVLSVAIPGSGGNLYTLLEYARDYRMSTALVTTAPITGSMPGGYGAHTADCTDTFGIASDYMTGAHPNLLFGGGGEGISIAQAQSAGYIVIVDQEGLISLEIGQPAYVSGQFGDGPLPFEQDGMQGLPHLSEMTASALDLLEHDPDGFFIVIEGSKIDAAAQLNDAGRMTLEVAEFANSVQKALDWAKGHGDTLILVLGSYETGGLKVVKNNGEGKIPGVTWSTTGRTAANVGVYLYGVTVRNFPRVIDNTGIPALVTGGNFRP